MSKITYVQEICSPIQEGSEFIFFKDTPFQRKDYRFIGTSYSVVKAYDGEKLIGALVAGVYPTDDLRRFSQFIFGENKYRNLWIDRIDVNEEYRGQGIGKEILRLGEEFLAKSQLPENGRENMYLVSITSAIPFYLSNGWKMIDTIEHDEIDSEYPCTYMVEYAVWMAKPIQGDKLENENLYFGDQIFELHLGWEVFYFQTGVENLSDEIYDRFIIEKEEEDENSPLDLIDTAIRVGYKLEIIKKIYQRLIKAIDRYGKLYLEPHIEVDISVTKRKNWNEVREWLSNTFPKEQLGKLVLN